MNTKQAGGFILLATLAIISMSSPGAAQGKGNGNAYAKGQPNNGANNGGNGGGGASGAPLPLLGATGLGQAAAAGGLFLIYLRRRNRRTRS